MIEASDALIGGHPGPPSSRTAKLGCVGDIIFLVSRPPCAIGYFLPSSVQKSDAIYQLDEARRICRSAADVEDLAAQTVHPALCQQEGVYEIVNIENIAHLMPVAIDGDGRVR